MLVLADNFSTVWQKCCTESSHLGRFAHVVINSDECEMKVASDEEAVVEDYGVETLGLADISCSTSESSARA